MEDRIPSTIVVKFSEYTGWEIFGYNASGTSGWSLGFAFVDEKRAVELGTLIANKLGIPVGMGE